MDQKQKHAEQHMCARMVAICQCQKKDSLLVGELLSRRSNTQVLTTPSSIQSGLPTVKMYTVTLGISERQHTLHQIEVCVQNMYERIATS